MDMRGSLLRTRFVECGEIGGRLIRGLARMDIWADEVLATLWRLLCVMRRDVYMYRYEVHVWSVMIPRLEVGRMEDENIGILQEWEILCQI